VGDAAAESAQVIRGAGYTLQWSATDGVGAWFVERGSDGATWQPAARPADVTVTGPAGLLLLALTRRLPLTDLSIDGATDLAQRWLVNTANSGD
jgi:hypothetical protein